MIEKKSRIYIDFDGTLIDSSYRQFKLFEKLAGPLPFNYEEYWSLKRAGIKQKQFLDTYLGMPMALQDAFSKKWMNEIESHEYLEWDTPFENIHHSLQFLNESWGLVLVTGRQYEDRCVSQLHRFGWKHLFEKILVTKQSISKQDLIRSSCLTHEGDIIVGDGPEEILAGRDLGINTVSVLSGATSFERLAKYSPDELFENFENFANSKG